MTFYFSVNYTPHPKADTQTWYTEQEAASLQVAKAEMEKRYPSSVPNTRATYNFREVSMVPKGAEFITAV